MKRCQLSMQDPVHQIAVKLQMILYHHGYEQPTADDNYLVKKWRMVIQPPAMMLDRTQDSRLTTIMRRVD
jgi:hypothetical protein